VTHAINTPRPKQPAPETPPGPAAEHDVGWDQVKAELMARLGRAQLTDEEDVEVRVWERRGSMPPFA
jgi:hypothetical protein